MGRKYTYEFVKEYIENEGYELLTPKEEYKSVSTKLSIKCDKGHFFHMTFTRFKNMSKRCPICQSIIRKDTHRISYEEACEHAYEFNCEILTPKQEYKNTETPLKFRCKNNHVFSKTFHNFKHSKHKCPTCASEIRGIKNRISEKTIEDFVIREGYILLSTNYKNNICYITLSCPKNHVFEVRWSSFKGSENKKGTRCPYCFGKLAPDFEEVKNKFEELNLTLLETEYINCSTPMKYVCNNHPEKGVQYKRYEDLKQGKGCKYCAWDRNSGSGSYLWNGGVTELNHFIRDNVITQWKKDSLKECEYKCALTNMNFHAIHHLHSFNKIVQETLNILKLPIYDKVSKYTEKELKQIEDKCLQLHYKYGLGISLHKDLHKLFHKLYGNKINTTKQFKEFITRLENGEFSDFLKENNLQLNISYDVLNKLLNNNELQEAI